jgi:Carboxypeptidase regulatory-like domain/TonB-dependent Receptor Plug Domain/TonB dependent receptor
MKLFPCLLLFALCLVPLSVLSQSTSATISGGVTDPTGNFITDASVEVVNDETGVWYSDRTNSSGMYFIPILPPGHYHVQVSKRGFKTIIKPDVVLNVQGAIALNFVLPVGAMSQSVTVEAGSSRLNTTDASISTVIDQKFVENIPLNGRSFQDLIGLTPGVVTQSPQSGSTVGSSGDFSVNGQRTESNYYTVDGVSANTNAGAPTGFPQAANSGSVGASTALGTTQSLISVDALQEFRVQSSTYAAEYGRSPGGQFSLVTRSGTNEYHGSAFDYLRNNYFDANDWFNDHFGKPITAMRQNDFGGTFGGPVSIPHVYTGRGRSFFFFSYEGLRLTQPQPAVILYVPDASLRTNAPSVLQPILNAFPIQSSGGIDYDNGLAQFIEPYSLPSQIDSTSIRFDQTFSSKVSAFFRYGNTPSSTSTRNLSSVTRNQLNNQTYTLGLTAQASATASNEFRLGYAQSSSDSIISLDNFHGAVPINLPNAMGLGSYPGSSPFFEIFVSGVGISELGVATSENKGHQWNGVDTFSLALGRHLFKFGADYRRIVSPLSPSSPAATALFESQHSVLTNSADLLLLSKYTSAVPVFNEFAAFAQDEWRVTSKLNLAFGLRWEIDPPPTEAHGNDAYTLLGNFANPSSLTLAPQGTPLWKTPWYNFAPRLGGAWTSHNTPGRETVLRAGAGVFFDSADRLATQGYGVSAVGFSTSFSYADASVPVQAAQLAFTPSILPPYTSSVVIAFPSHLQLPYTLGWSASLEQALGGNQSLSLSYVGSNGRRLIQRQQLSVHSLNPEFGTIIYVPGGITSNYQALQVQYQRNVKRGLHALAAYTWSHSIDFGSQDTALPVTRASSDFDVRHNFQGGLSWDLPDSVSNAFLAPLLRAWGLDFRAMARSGYPITLLGNHVTDPVTGSQYYTNVNLVSGVPLYLYGTQFPGGRAINRSAVSLPTGSDPGNAPRNFLRGFDAVQINLAARREFTLHDRLKLQFRAETFNILNHPNFGYIDPTLTDATFGQATKMLNSSLGTVSSLYQQGGARSMQFALKLMF